MVGLSKDGIILETDDTGSIIKQASPAQIQDAWLPPLRMTVDAYLAEFGEDLRSVYVRGSVPLGTAREYVSDIDTFCVVDRGGREVNLAWEESHNRAVKARFPFVRYVELRAFPAEAVETSRRLSAVIKTQSACVHGTDFADEIPGLRPGPDLISEGWWLPKDMALAKLAAGAAKDSDGVREVCVWAMKQLLRSGLELVMERARCYTRDLYPCYRIFATYHPEKAAAMASALALAVNPSGDPEPIKQVINDLGSWLYERICMEYGAHRVGQILRVHL